MQKEIEKEVRLCTGEVRGLVGESHVENTVVGHGGEAYPHRADDWWYDENAGYCLVAHHVYPFAA